MLIRPDCEMTLQNDENDQWGWRGRQWEAARAESLARILKICIKQGAVSLEVWMLATTLFQTCGRALGSSRLVIRKPGFYNNK